MGVALPLSCHWALAHHWALFSYLCYVFVCTVFHTCLCCVPARGVAWATHSLPGVPGTGVLWVSTGTHPCAPDAQAVWHRSQSASPTYVGRRPTDSRKRGLYTCHPAPLLDLVVVTIWSTSGACLLSDLIHLFIHELLAHARRHMAWLCTAMSRPIQPELPWYCSMP